MDLVKWIGLFIFISVCMPVNSQEIDVSHNSSKYGGYFREATYKAKWETQSVVAQYVDEQRGDKYYLNYHYSADPYFAFGTYKKDNILKSESVDLGLGYGKYIYKDKNFKEKLSYAIVFRETKFISSIRFKTYAKYNKIVFKNIYYILVGVAETSSESDLSYKLGKNVSIGYKLSHTTAKTSNNYADRLYIKFKFLE